MNHEKEKDRVSHFVIMGDSLSDRGTLSKRKLFGFIPMGWLTGLFKDSPKGRFTNGYTWSDDISALMANIFTINMIKNQYSVNDIDIADAIINGDPKIRKTIRGSYNLDDDTGVKLNGRDLVRSYSEGGLTSHNYSRSPSYSMPRMFARLILSSLDKMRHKLFADDQKNKVSPKQKANTLVVEWSGANDLMTVNAHPSKAEAEKAVAERIKNARELIQHGYKNFVLFNLPDLSLTPRYQAKNRMSCHNAHTVSEYFNRRLAEEVKKLNADYPDVNADVFDINKTFNEVYKHPEKYGFDRAKLKEPYTHSKEFADKGNGTSPASGYMFWDDVHPTADMHAVLSELFYEKYSKKYDFNPEEAKMERTQSEPNLRRDIGMSSLMGMSMV